MFLLFLFGLYMMDVLDSLSNGLKNISTGQTLTIYRLKQDTPRRSFLECLSFGVALPKLKTKLEVKFKWCLYDDRVARLEDVGWQAVEVLVWKQRWWIEFNEKWLKPFLRLWVNLVQRLKHHTITKSCTKTISSNVIHYKHKIILTHEKRKVTTYCIFFLENPPPYGEEMVKVQNWGDHSSLWFCWWVWSFLIILVPSFFAGLITW